MTKTMNATIGSTFLFFLTLAALGALVLPMTSNAADYAFVNNAGYVELVTADNASMAMMNAQQISLHSGVCLLSKPSDYSMVGKFVRTVQQGS